MRDGASGAALRRVHGVMRLVRRSRPAAVGAAICLSILVLAIVGPLVSPVDPSEQDLGAISQPPSRTHLLGTDQLGRDALSRVMWGARLSLSVSVSAVAAGAGVGIAAGMLAGYFRGTVDLLVMRVVDVLLAFPMYLLALVVMAILGPSLRNVVVAVAVGTSPRFARLVRGEVLKQRETVFVESARAVGASDTRIMAIHILPNVVDTALVMGSLLVGTAILVEASLSFLGVGLPPPTPAWGLMVNEGLVYLRSAPWVPVIPGVAIAVTVLGLNLLGDGLRDLLDPRSDVHQ